MAMRLLFEELLMLYPELGDSRFSGAAQLWYVASEGSFAGITWTLERFVELTSHLTRRDGLLGIDPQTRPVVRALAEGFVNFIEQNPVTLEVSDLFTLLPLLALKRESERCQTVVRAALEAAQSAQDREAPALSIKDLTYLFIVFAKYAGFGDQICSLATSCARQSDFMDRIYLLFMQAQAQGREYSAHALDEISSLLSDCGTRDTCMAWLEVCQLFDPGTIAWRYALEEVVERLGHVSFPQLYDLVGRVIQAPEENRTIELLNQVVFCMTLRGTISEWELVLQELSGLDIPSFAALLLLTRFREAIAERDRTSLLKAFRACSQVPGPVALIIAQAMAVTGSCESVLQDLLASPKPQDQALAVTLTSCLV